MELVHKLSVNWDSLQYALNNVIDYYFNQNRITLFIPIILSLIIILLFRRSKQLKIYVRDFEVFQSDDQNWKHSNSKLLKQAQKMNFSANSLNFMRKVSKHNGIGPDVVMPPEIFTSSHTVDDAREESKTVMFQPIRQLFDKTGVKPEQIDVLVTNCSLFAPLPSLSSLIVNEFKMKQDIHSFSLGGMGCSASPIGVDVIQAFLQNKNMKYALLVSTENMMQNYYTGNDASMLLPNTLFRAGCAAVLFTNIKYNCKYVIKSLIRTHTGADSNAHKCIEQTTDKDGIKGVKLEKTIIANASKALMINSTHLFRQILPLFLKIDYIWQIVLLYLKWFVNTRIMKIQTTYPKYQPPKINKAVNNFCFHTGGRGVLDSMQLQFNLSDNQIAASRATLYKYGNTSSPSIWYELAYHEQTNQIISGNLIWQIAFGSGFKCNSIVLKALKTINKDQTLFDKYNSECVFDPSVLLNNLVDEEQMNTNYDQIVNDMQKNQEEADWERIKVRFMDKIQQIASIKQIQDISK
ncbi:3-ketoacyl-CoA_synthase [Hexamita inflata]|uniref:3-ketoacyl-CoA synthase n=1 Tax=Hexamita inflata TaxID=28002 RepID=A0ABP1H870_9EUKA